jgi:hypothetical protein
LLRNTGDGRDDTIADAANCATTLLYRRSPERFFDGSLIPGIRQRDIPDVEYSHQGFRFKTDDHGLVICPVFAKKGMKRLSAQAFASPTLMLVDVTVSVSYTDTTLKLIVTAGKVSLVCVYYSCEPSFCIRYLAVVVCSWNCFLTFDSATYYYYCSGRHHLAADGCNGHAA